MIMTFFNRESGAYHVLAAIRHATNLLRVNIR